MGIGLATLGKLELGKHSFGLGVLWVKLLGTFEQHNRLGFVAFLREESTQIDQGLG